MHCSSLHCGCAGIINCFRPLRSCSTFPAEDVDDARSSDRDVVVNGLRSAMTTFVISALTMNITRQCKAEAMTVSETTRGQFAVASSHFANFARSRRAGIVITLREDRFPLPSGLLRASSSFASRRLSLPPSADRDFQHQHTEIRARFRSGFP